ncbi:AI-2E family transporter [Actinomadura sp. 9N407]|uniref:AI-2E family transporter n=1 Tax=Actinomadura sp. 9N407 TaxID=3375154 RepID=UPI0037A42FBD
MSEDMPPKERPPVPEGTESTPGSNVPAPSPPPDDAPEASTEADAEADAGAEADAAAGAGAEASTAADADADGEESKAAGRSVEAPAAAATSGGNGVEIPETGGSVRLGDVASVDDAEDPPRKDEADRLLPVPVTASSSPSTSSGSKGPALGSDAPASTVDTPDPAHDLEQRKREAGVDKRFPFGRPGQPLGQTHPFVFGFTGALGVITAWLLIQAAANARSVLIMLVVAMFLAVGLNPAVERIKRFGLSRGWSVAVVFLLVLLFFAGFVASLVPPLTEQITALTRNVPIYIEQLQNNPKIAEWDQRYHLLEQAQKKISDAEFQETLATRAYEVGRQAVSGTVQTLTILILTLYFLGSLPQIKTFFYQLAPRSRRARVALLGDEILDRIGGYVAGQFTIAFIAGLISYIFLEILGIPYALALSLIVAVTALIPLIGATIGAVIVTIVAFLHGVPEGIASIVFYVIYQQLENYLIHPRIMKRTVDVQPAVTIVAALVGAALLGVIGALLAIPTAAAISLVIREVFLPRQESL